MSLHVFGDPIGCSAWSYFSEISVHSNNVQDFQLNENDYILFSFCNVDCFFIDQKNMESAIRNCVDAYFKRINSILKDCKLVRAGVSSVVPYHTNFPLQIHIRKLFNKRIEEKCEGIFDYINLHSLYEGPDGYMPQEYCEPVTYRITQPCKLIPIVESLITKYSLDVDISIDKLLIETNVFNYATLRLDTHLSRLRPELKKLFAGKKNILVLGMNRGHAVNIALQNSDANVTATSIADIDLTTYLEMHFSDKFPGRLKVIRGQTMNYLNRNARAIISDPFDIVYINRYELWEWSSKDKYADLNAILNFFKYNCKPILVFDHYSEKHFDCSSIVTRRIIRENELGRAMSIRNVIHFDQYNSLAICDYKDTNKSAVIPPMFITFLEKINKPAFIVGAGSMAELIQITTCTNDIVYDFEDNAPIVTKMRQDVWSLKDYYAKMCLLEDSVAVDAFCISNNLNEIGLLCFAAFTNLRELLSLASDTLKTTMYFLVHYKPSDEVGSVSLAELFAIAGRAGLIYLASEEYGLASFPLRSDSSAKLLFRRC